MSEMDRGGLSHRFVIISSDIHERMNINWVVVVNSMPTVGQTALYGLKPISCQFQFQLKSYFY